MEVQHVSIDRKIALGLYREYKKHVHYSTPMDAEIRRAYQLIAQGKLVINARQSIADAGLKEDGYPHLAIARATTRVCHVELRNDGSAAFKDKEWRAAARNTVELAAGALPFSHRFNAPDKPWRIVGKATVPPIPVALRPKRGMENYHILWEAEWTPVPPVDPMLLRRVGKSDMWLVVAAWDLTPVERAAMSSRMTN